MSGESFARHSSIDSNSEFPGRLGEIGSASFESNFLASGRPDEALTELADDFSRARTFVSAASGDDDDVEGDPEPYYHPAMPTPAENPAPPPPPLRPEDPTPFQAFLAAPIDYIFGGNGYDDDDDDVSTLDGGGFSQDTVTWADGDDTTRSGTPLKPAFKATQPVIYEDDDEEEAGGSQRGADQYYEQETEDDLDDDNLKAEENLYTTSEYLQAHWSDGQRDKDENSLYPTESSSGNNQDVKRSSHSIGRSFRSSVSDEDAARSRVMDDDMSISLSVALRTRINQSHAPLPLQETEALSSSYAPSVQSSLSEGLRSSITSNKSWRSVKLHRSGIGERSSRGMGSSAPSFRSANSLMPEIPEIIPSTTQGAPMMTRGMSGRAVVHVSMDCSGDGSIDRLDYTMPVIDVPVETDAEYFEDEDTVVAGNKNLLPWYDYYFSRSKIIRTCHSRKCYRINAVLILAVTFILTVSISVTTIVSSEHASSSSSASSSALLQDMAVPKQVTGVKLPTDIDTRLKNWFSAEGMRVTEKDDVPFYFHIPLSGALIASECWTRCLGFIVASDGGKTEVTNSTLKAIQVAGSSFVNVDLSHLQGIEHAANMNLVPSSLPDVAISPLFNDAIKKLFSQSHPTTLVMTMRHPISRAVAMFDYMKKNQSDLALAAMTLEQYALSGRIENNYVVRLLTGKSTGGLSVDDVNFCKELLRQKAVVGLYEDMERSVHHFQRYFGWARVTGDVMNCENQLIAGGLAQESAMTLDQGSAAYSLIQQQNLHDIAVYDYMRNVLVPFQMEVVSRQLEGFRVTGS